MNSSSRAKDQPCGQVEPMGERVFVFRQRFSDEPYEAEAADIDRLRREVVAGFAADYCVVSRPALERVLARLGARPA